MATTTAFFPTTTSSYNSHMAIHSNKMNIFRKFSSKKSSRVSQTTPDKDASINHSTGISRDPSASLISQTVPTRRPRAADPPPAYSASNRDAVVAPTPVTTNVPTTDSPYAFLAQFDTVFLIDDSGSMAGRSWRETSAALSAITPICTQFDADGVDIYFLNHRNRTPSNLGGYSNVKDCAGVQEIFNSVRPLGGTPTGQRLNNILKPYISSLEAQARLNNGTDSIKPLNIIVITDGVPSDDVESVIVSAARKLDAINAESWQVGIQFFQVGQEPEAAEELRELDDALSGTHGIRDIVDTVPWSGENGQTLSADGILKVVLGAVNRRLDRRQGTDERLRQ